jgi:hypothetical protein
MFTSIEVASGAKELDMKKHEIKAGGTYVAKVANNLTTVRVDRIMNQTSFGKACTTYAVTNLVTRRETTFRSAAKFRSVVRLTRTNAPTRARRSSKRHNGHTRPNCVSGFATAGRTIRPQTTQGENYAICETSLPRMRPAR